MGCLRVFLQLLSRLLLANAAILSFTFRSPLNAAEAEYASDYSYSFSAAKKGDLALQSTQYDLAIDCYQASLERDYSAAVASNLARAFWLRAQKYRRLAAEAEREGELAEARALERQQARDRAAAVSVAEAIPSASPLAYTHGLLTRYEAGEPLQARISDQIEGMSAPPNLLVRAGLVLDDPSYFQQALALARRTGDTLVRARARYELGLVAAAPVAARQHFQAAALLAQPFDDSPIYYRALYRLYKLTGDFAALSEATRALTQYRELSTHRDSLQSFATHIEPAYRDYARELLYQQRYAEALQAIDRLQLAEVESYLAADCFFDVAEPVAGKTLRYIVLESELWLVLLDSGQVQRVERVAVSAAELERLVREFRVGLESYGVEKYFPQAQRLHALLIAPVRDEIGQELTIIADDSLRTIPFAALHDGRFFLVERTALRYSLQLSVHSQPLKPELKGAFVGVSQPPADLEPLPHVSREAAASALEVFLDPDASLATLQSVVADGPQVLHLATHARYGSLDRSWIQLYDRRVSAREFEAMLQGSEIAFLILAGCETAAGDRQAALGMASLAISTGTDRVLGSLWAYREGETTDLMPVFYKALREGTSPAAALRQAQLTAIDAGYHPSSWASLILVD